MEDIQLLSVDELIARAGALPEQREAFKAELQRQHDQNRIALATELKALIRERGHGLVDKPRPSAPDQRTRRRS